VFLNCHQIAESWGEVEPCAWAPKGRDFAGRGGCDLWDDLGRSVLPEHDIIQGASNRGGGRLLRHGFLGPLGMPGGGLGRWALECGAEKAVIDDGDRVRLVD